MNADNGSLVSGGGDKNLPPFLTRRLPPSFERRVVVLEPGCTRAYEESEWRDAIVLVERGQVELDQHGDDRRRFARGDILWLAGLPLRTLYNPGREPAVLVAVSRRTAVDAEHPEPEH